MTKGTTSNSEKRWARIFTVIAVLIFAASGYAWWHYVRSNPERTFYAAIENNLRTGGFTKTVVQESGPQKLKQGVQFSTGAQNVAHAQTTLTQSGDTNALVKTETISTPKEEYTRYNTIQTDQKKADGSAMDFSGLEGQWGKADAAKGGESYIDATLGIVPAGNLPAAKRQELMKMIRDKNIYKIDDTQRGIENNRPVYTFEVTVPTQAYVELLKAFDQATGVNRLESVDPSNYKDSEPLTFQVKIDVWSQRIAHLSYAGGQRDETVGSYGIPRKVALPTDAIPIEELQNKLQATQE